MGLGTWVSFSRRRTARFLRGLVADMRRPVTPAPVKPEPAKWPENRITLCWLGHSTVLVDFYGLKVLTDPAFGTWLGLPLGVGTLGVKRYIAPALTPAELPPLDVILLSHGHRDHLDGPSLAPLCVAGGVVTAKATADLLAGTRLKPITELAWGERTVLRTPKGQLEVEAFEVKHWGERWPSQKPRGYNGYIFRREGKALLFGGDTAWTPRFAGLRSRGPFAAALMPIGAYRPWVRNHCTPEESLAMANHAGADYFVPIHHETFRLSDEPMTEPIERLTAALAGEPERLALRRVGESFTL